MSIVEKIKNSITAATGLKCYYQSEGDLNRIFDNAEFPSAFFVLLQSGQANTANGNYRERVQIAVFFCDLSGFDDTAMKYEHIIEKCKERAFLWLSRLNKSELKLVSINGTNRAYHEYDVMLAGFAVNVTVEELVGVTVCELGNGDGRTE